MQTSFDLQSGQWLVDWPGRVARHDVVYLSPPQDPMQGLPIGNGDVGVLAWCEDSRLILAVNKCDLWDAAPFTRFRNWAAEEEERSSALRHAGRIVIDFGLPVFDVFYLSDFSGRLSLADGSLRLEARGPFGQVAVSAFVSHDDGVLCVDVSGSLPGGPPVRIGLERYGSRTFGHWYALVNRDPAIGLDGTEAQAGSQGMCLRQALAGGAFAAGCRVIASGGPVVYAREHAHRAAAQAPSGDHLAFTLLAAVTSPAAGDPIPDLQRRLDAAQAAGQSALYDAHARAWRSFWQRSYLSFGDDYLDNLWHLTLYYANASQRGAYPGRFINGLWGWSRDVQNWTFYFHWNQQELYWPLNAAGHPELVDAYLAYRFDGLPPARQDAAELFNAPGAFVSDVTDHRGYNSLSELENHTPVAQVALDFWRQYQYTRDPAFLRQRAMPYLAEAAAFFETLFERGPDGLYHARSGTGYEGWIRLCDAITELACARALFRAAIDAARLCCAGSEAPAPHHLARWQDLLDHLAPFPTLAPAGCFEPAGGDAAYRLARGPFKGQPARIDRAFAAGYGIREERLLASKFAGDPPPPPPPPPIDAYALLQRLEANTSPYSSLQDDLQYFDGIFPSVELSPVFPSGLIGLADQGDESYDLAANTVRLYGPEAMGWDTLPIVLARLGLAGELAAVLKRFPSRWQFYCNGWGHYGPRDVMKADGALRFRASQVMDACLPKEERESRRFPLGMWPFRHMGMESMSVLACAMNEALLHSHDGVIRIAPAVTAQQQARFTLHATGGFVVSAQVDAGRPAWAQIESRLGGLCRLANPWEALRWYCNGEPAGRSSERILDVETRPGDRLTFLPAGANLPDWIAVPESAAPNQAPKSCPIGVASLGLPRMF